MNDGWGSTTMVQHLWSEEFIATLGPGFYHLVAFHRCLPGSSFLAKILRGASTEVCWNFVCWSPP